MHTQTIVTALAECQMLTCLARHIKNLWLLDGIAIPIIRLKKHGNGLAFFKIHTKQFGIRKQTSRKLLNRCHPANTLIGSP
jgi:hypothetical protein